MTNCHVCNNPSEFSTCSLECEAIAEQSSFRAYLQQQEYRAIMNQEPAKRYCRNKECGAEIINPESNGTRYCCDDCRPYHAKYYANKRKNQVAKENKKDEKVKGKINPFFLTRGKLSLNKSYDTQGAFVY